MHRSRFRLVSAIVLSPLLAGPSTADDPKPGESLASAPIEHPEPVPGGEAMGGLYRSGPIYLAGQPGKEDLERFARDGVTVVINLRTPREMESVPFDEPGLLRSLEVDYVHIPIGPGPHAPRAEAVSQLNEALTSHRGKAVIHCASAFRSTQLWAAHLVRDRDVDRTRADAFSRAVTGAPAMIEQYLGQDPDRP